MNPFYVTFFSFKGGAGRTTAAMNTAIHLAKQKKRVLVIDLDLQAPGIDIFDVPHSCRHFMRVPSYHPARCWAYLNLIKGLPPEQRARNAHSEVFTKAHNKNRFTEEVESIQMSNAFCGFLELVRNFEKEKRVPELVPFDFEYDEPPNEDRPRYVYALPRREAGMGDILMMRAAAYDNQDHYEKLLSGDLMASPKTRNSADHRPLDIFEPSSTIPEFVSSLKERIAKDLKPDYVLVDARPGFDAISRYATDWFGDCCVLVSNLNPWNLRGIIRAYEKIRQGPSQVEQPNLLLLISPIPNYATQSKLYDGQYATISENLKHVRNNGTGSEGSPIEIPYSDILALRDILISDVEENDISVTRFSDLSRLIVAGNPEDLENRIDSAEGAGEPNRVKASFERLFHEHHRSEVLHFRYGRYLSSIGKYDDAAGQLDNALRILDEKDKGAQDQLRRDSPFLGETLFERCVVKKALAEGELEKAVGHVVGDEQSQRIKKTQEEAREAGNRLAAGLNEKGGFAKYYAMLGRIEMLMAECEWVLDLASGDPGSERKNKIKNHLKNAQKEFAEARCQDKRSPEFSRELGDAYGAEFLLGVGANDERSVTQAIEQLNESRLLKGGNPDTYLQLGRFYLAKSIKWEARHGGVQLLPLFEPGGPFVRLSPDSKKSDEIFVRNLTSAPEEMRNAIRNLETTTKHRRHDFFAHFNLGLARSLHVKLELDNGSHTSLDDEQELLSQLTEASSEMQVATLYNPLYSPAYLYDSAIQFFLLSHREKSAEETNDAIRETTIRHAFYRLEHFIDLEIKGIVSRPLRDRLTTAGMPELPPFYFDPDDIESIKKHPAEFMRTVEIRLGWPPIVELFFLDESRIDETRLQPVEAFVEMQLAEVSKAED